MDELFPEHNKIILVGFTNILKQNILNLSVQKDNTLCVELWALWRYVGALMLVGFRWSPRRLLRRVGFSLRLVKKWVDAINEAAVDLLIIFCCGIFIPRCIPKCQPASSWLPTDSHSVANIFIKYSSYSITDSAAIHIGYVPLSVHNTQKKAFSRSSSRPRS